MPNSGKSTLMNSVLNYDLSPVTHKCQTTRNKIIGIYNSENIQFILIDTPGVLKKQHGRVYTYMSKIILSSLYDSDIILVLLNVNDSIIDNKFILNYVSNIIKKPLCILINKIDICNQNLIQEKIQWVKTLFINKINIYAISAKYKYNIIAVLNFITNNLPINPPFFDDINLISNQNKRFFIAKIIEKHIINNYHKEVPYASVVVIRDYKKNNNIDCIYGDIIVEKESQRKIIIGYKGNLLKKISIGSRIDIELFLTKKIYLNLNVKVFPNWRNNNIFLKKIGY